MGKHIIIPARANSSRLPGKVLLEVEGKPLIQYTYLQACQCQVDAVTITTDDSRIQTVCEGFGASVLLSSSLHQNGTERVAEAAEKLQLNDDDIVINLQADEPLIQPAAINSMLNEFEPDHTLVQTLVAPITKMTDVFDTNIVKAVLNVNQDVMLFSRAPIPWDKSGMKQAKELLSELYFGHIGVYAYQVNHLKQYQEMTLSTLEQIECLEQLRVLYHGKNIRATIVNDLPVSINTTDDIKYLQQYMATVLSEVSI